MTRVVCYFTARYHTHKVRESCLAIWSNSHMFFGCADVYSVAPYCDRGVISWRAWRQNVTTDIAIAG